MKILKLLLLFFITFTFSACHPSIFNPDSYEKKWENIFLWFNPNDLETIYISANGDINSAKDVRNKSEYEIIWIKTGDNYELTFTSYFHRIDFAWFEGYPVDNPDEEIPFVIENNTYHLSSNKLLPPKNGLYRISLSKDLTK